MSTKGIYYFLLYNVVMFKDALEKSYFHARPFNGKDLTAQDLINHKLFPKYQVTVGDRKIYLSDKFKIANNEVPRLIAYIKDYKGRYLVSSFFQSKSQGLYRLLRAYKYRVDEEGNEQPKWNDKGYSEWSIMLPLELQYFISTQIKTTLKIEDKISGIEVFYGTAMESATDKTYTELIVEEPLKIIGKMYSSKKEELLPPEDIYIEQSDKPNFKNLTLTWQFEAAIYGKTTARVFKSVNSKYSYLFLTDSDKRTWVGGIDNDSEVTVLGIRKRWVDLGSFGTPAYEYQYDSMGDGKYKVDQTFGYGNRDLIYEDTYVDMYKNYLSNISLIQEFNSIYAR